MGANVLQGFLDEPAVADPPRRVWRDWVLAVAVIAGSIIEAVFRTDVPAEIPSLAISVVVAVALLWRRTHPLATMVVAFGAIAVMSLAVEFVDDRPAGFYSMAFVLVAPYALFRWGSGRDATLGVPVMVGSWLIGITTDPGTIGEAVGGLVVLAIPAIVGVEVRQLRQSRERAIDRARLAERELLARELHDTVAHHVSAIAIQAQAGRAVAGTRPDAALEALAVIEDAASRTLTEMRTMVAALRHDGEGADLAPQYGVSDIERLGGFASGGPVVDVHLDGDLTDLRPSVDAAVYRIAQESVTNASRHAVGATRVAVRVVGEAGRIHLRVADDGRPTAAFGETTTGFGLVGMAERATLLGGSLEAGWSGEGGWVVDAVIPREHLAT